MNSKTRMLFIAIFTSFLAANKSASELNPERLIINSIDSLRANAKNISIAIIQTEDNQFECMDVSIYFPSIKNENGVKSVVLLSKELNGKISFISHLTSQVSTPRNPPRPGEKIPPLTENDRNSIHFCSTKQQIHKSTILITYGAPYTLCLGDSIEIILSAFLE